MSNTQPDTSLSPERVTRERKAMLLGCLDGAAEQLGRAQAQIDFAYELAKLLGVSLSGELYWSADSARQAGHRLSNAKERAQEVRDV